METSRRLRLPAAESVLSRVLRRRAPIDQKVNKFSSWKERSMRKHLIFLAVLCLSSPLAALAATGAEAAGGAAAIEDGGMIVSSPLLDLVDRDGVAQAGCSEFTPCETVNDCGCQAPDCACVPISGCRGFDHICLCRDYCFGGSQP
jgi:hypothetical protein